MVPQPNGMVDPIRNGIWSAKVWRMKFSLTEQGDRDEDYDDWYPGNFKHVSQAQGSHLVA